ncbi:MAG: ABC transporter ATP-binding protein [Spirochaetales bacterium]|nr:ABC transporter ATP-binding protein [Spirochaetales bacterium]
MENITKRFYLSRKKQKLEGLASREKTAVKGLSFSVAPGEIFGLLGPNGAGKTTAMRIIAGLMKPDSGDVFLSGRSIKKAPAAGRNQIGFLTADLKLDEFFTPEYLFDFFMTLRGLSKERAAKQKKFFFEGFGIGDYAHERFSTLSSGMKQKAALIISIAHDPDIIILDEPTNGLDLLAAKMIVDFLLELKNQGKTILLSTHIFSLAEKICGRAGFIIDGRMLKSGPLPELTKKKPLEEAFFAVYNDHLSGKQQELC